MPVSEAQKKAIEDRRRIDEKSKPKRQKPKPEETAPVDFEALSFKVGARCPNCGKPFESDANTVLVPVIASHGNVRKAIYLCPYCFDFSR